MLTKRKSDRPDESAEHLAISVLGWLATTGPALVAIMLPM